MNPFLIIDCGSSKVPQIEATLRKLEFDSVTFRLSERATWSWTTFSGIIVSGAPILLTEVSPEPHLKTFEFLLSQNLPILGICFGHQVLGMLHGSKVYRCDEARSDQEIDVLQEGILFDQRINNTYNEDHCEAISLPSGWVHLAQSKVCENEAMKHPDLPLYGVQFHPETSGENGSVLLKNFCISCR